MKPRNIRKLKRTPLPKTPKRLTYRKRYWYMSPFAHDVDLMKPERIHGLFCGCGRRMQGEAECAHCSNGLDYDERYA